MKLLRQELVVCGRSSKIVLVVRRASEETCREGHGYGLARESRIFSPSLPKHMGVIESSPVALVSGSENRTHTSHKTK